MRTRAHSTSPVVGTPSAIPVRERRGQEGQKIQGGFPGVVSLQSEADLGRRRDQRIT